MWNATGDIELYVDIATPATWPSPDHVTMIDLDLDVFRRRDGSVALDDEDEFLEHQIAYGYPEDVVFHARQSADYLMDAVRERREPFGFSSESWLERVSGEFRLG